MVLPFDVPGPAFRARQVSHWIFRNFAARFEEMTNVPADVRGDLASSYGPVRPDPLIIRTADSGNTLKAVFPGGYETVVMRYAKRTTVCISSQAGCGLGCTFCATGQMGLIRNLSAFEIVSQVLWAGRSTSRRPDNVVFMGMGEPLANPNAVMDAIHSLNSDVGISARKITVSTVGIVPQIRRLAALPVPVRLALSLHAPDDETRSELVPINRRWPIAECLASAREFRRAHGRRVSIEYALIAARNDNPWQAELLGKLLRGTDFHVNLIPLNPTPSYGVPASGRIDEFAKELIATGVNVTIRDTRGRDIDAACGQLASESAAVN